MLFGEFEDGEEVDREGGATKFLVVGVELETRYGGLELLVGT